MTWCEGYWIFIHVHTGNKRSNLDSNLVSCLFKNIYFIFSYVFLCMSLWEYGTCAGRFRVQNRALVALDLELEATVSYHMGM